MNRGEGRGTPLSLLPAAHLLCLVLAPCSSAVIVVNSLAHDSAGCASAYSSAQGEGAAAAAATWAGCCCWAAANSSAQGAGPLAPVIIIDGWWPLPGIMLC